MTPTTTGAATSSSVPSHPAYSLLARAHSPTTASELFTTKIKQKPLLLRASSPPAGSNSRALRRHIRLRKKEYFLGKQKPRPLSAKQKRQLGVHELKKEECKFSIYAGLHKMWVGYMQEVLGLNQRNKNITAQSHGSLLASADFHGAETTVVQSGCVDRVGLSGIVVRDTKFTFVIVTPKDEVKTIPKKDTVFRFEIPVPKPDVAGAQEHILGAELADTEPASRKQNLAFELHGNQFEVRPADRANKKFKWKTMDYM